MKTKHLAAYALLLFSCTSASSIPSITSSNDSDSSLLSSSSLSLSSNSTTSSESVVTIDQVFGLDDTTTILGHYFNPLKGVRVLTNTGEDFTALLQVRGHVDFSTLGSYTLTYSIAEGDLTYSKTRTIQVINGTYVAPTNPKTYITTPFDTLGEGSYRTGLATNISHPVNPNFIELDLLDKPIPTNQWWTSLAMSNYGNSNGIYTNPLRSSFTNDGVELTNPGEGFTQFWNPEGFQTIAQFSLGGLKDYFIKPSSLIGGYQTRVIDYSDNTIKVAMRPNNSLRDHMVVTYNQGSPFIFGEVGQIDPLIFTAGIDGVGNYEYFSLDGNLISSRSHQGDGIIIKFQNRHVGYQTNPPASVGQPIFADRYFLLNLPKNSTMTMINSGHPQGLYHRLSVQLGEGNYFSMGAINSVQEGAFYHQHGYSFPIRGHGLYRVDHSTNLVRNRMVVQTSAIRADRESLPLLALLPHHHKLVQEPVSNYTIRTVRGLLKILVGHSFHYHLHFRGVVPSYTLPQGSSFSEATMRQYLTSLNEQTDPLNPDNFYNSPTPYWNSKATYPLTQGALIADQLGETSLRDQFLLKLNQHLTDWFNFTNTDDARYLYYNDRWGTTYYSDNEFNTASEISDHSFTHGYLIFASAILAKFDPVFYQQYQPMIMLLMKDYMNHDATDLRFPVMRSFDRYAGHSWAHGFGSFAEGNNLESTGEAINSWVAAYHVSLLEKNQAMMDAAIYGYVHETYAAQQYWFDYDQDIWSQKYREYAGVVGILWGGKYDYATWFGANPTFIYGIQWIPTGEYLSSYIVGSQGKNRLTQIYNKYLNSRNGAVDRWYAYMWPVQALVNPAAALDLFDATKILNDEYPAELAMAYYMIQAMQDYQYKASDAFMQLHDHVSSSIYLDQNNQRVALVYNSGPSTTVTFVVNGVNQTKTISANSFTTVSLS